MYMVPDTERKDKDVSSGRINRVLIKPRVNQDKGVRNIPREVGEGHSLRERMNYEKNK